MRSNIIKKGTADEVRCAVTELRLSETFMDVPQLSVKVVSSTPIAFEIGDYITYDYNGVTYTLRSIPEAAKNARPSTYGGAFVYNLVFYSPMWDLRNAPFLDLVLYDNGQHFTSMPDVTTYEDVYGIAARVQANMDNMYPGKWEIRVVSGLSADSTLAQKLSETQDFSLSDGKCLDALSQVYSQWGVSFVYSYEGGKHVITIGGAETQEDTTGLFMYGRGNGLKVIKSSVQNASEIATRYYVYGGTQNMQPRYYNGRTMEPEYIHASDASNPTVTAICSGRRLLGDNMYVPNLMIPVSKWGKTKWYVWTASSHSQEVFTEVRNPSAGDDFAFDEPNIGSSRNVISSVSSGGIVVNGFTYQYLTEVLYPDIRKAYIDAPQSYLDKYGIRPATLRFDGSGEREDIHPSIKGLTIGDIRAGLGSGAEYYPSASVYTDPDERVDEVLSCDNPQDDGLTSSGANKYESSSSIAVAAVEKEFELALSNRAGNKIYTLGGRGSYYVLSEGAQFQVQYDGVLNARIPIQFSLATEGRDDRIHCRAGVKVNKTTSSGVESVIGSSVDEKAVVDLSTIDMDLSVDISGVSVQSGDTISVDIELYTLTTKSHDKVTVNIEAFTARYNIAISLGTDFYIKLKQIGFDISEVPTNDGESPVISMTSGQCGGYEFEIHDVSYNASDDSWTLRCARVQDGTLGQWFPNSIFKIEPDDTFVLLNIALPEVYITANEQRLYDAALAERLYEERPLLEPEIDSKVMAESLQVLRAGMWFSVKDTDLGLADADGGSYLILIDSVEVTDKPDTIRSFKVTLRNNKEDNVFVRMQRQIAQTSASVQSGQRSQTKTSVSEVPTKGGGGGEYIDTSDFVTLSTDQTITGKKTFANDVVFGGEVSDGVYGKLLIPSTAGPGIYGLLVSDEPVQGEAPSGSGGLDKAELWLELGGSTDNPVIGKDHLPGDTVYTDDLAGYALKSELPDLTPYATQEWVTGQGYATQTWVKGRGYLTATDADGRYVNIAGDTMTGSLRGTDIELSGHISAATLYVPYSGGNKIYSLSVSDTPVQGEAPSGGGGLDSAALWEELGGNATDKVIGLSRIPDIPVDMVSGLLGGDSRILPSLLPDWLMGQLLYGGTVDGSSVATVSAAFKDRYGTGGDTVTLNASNASQYECVYFIASADASSGVVQSLGVRTGDWVVSNGLAWTKIDNTDSVSSVAGLTGVISKTALQTALSDSTHRFVTDAQTAAWDAKWTWDEEDIKAVKVNAAVLADKAKALNAARSLWGQSFDGTGDVDGDMSGVGGITMSGSIAGAVNADFSGYLSAGTLYVPYSGGSKVYSLKVSDAPVSGESPSGGGGMDADALWLELGGSTDDKVIAKSHLPEDTVYEGDLAGYALKSEIPSLAGYATQSWVQSQGYLKSVSLATISDLHSSWDAVLKTQKPAWLTTVSLATISDLHSSWDALLKAAKPTTLAGYGITDAYTKAQVNSKLGLYLPLTGGTLTGMLNGTNIELSGYISASVLYIPSTSGNKVYSLKVSDAPVSGESPSAGGGGLDVDAMWDELEATDASKVIDASHIPLLDMEKVNGLPTALSVVNASLNAMSEALQDKADISDIPSLSGYVNSVTTSGAGNAVTGFSKSGNTLTLVKGTTFLTSVPKATSSAYGGIKIGYPESGKNYPVVLDSSGRAYVNVPWVNTTYSLSSFGITATAEEINKLDGVGTLLHSGNYTSYTVTKTGGGASGTWGINISGNAASATRASYITPRLFGNQGTIGALKSSILAAMDDYSLLKYPGQSYITSGSDITTIMNNWSNDGFSIPAGSQEVFTRLDNYGSSTYGVFLVSGYSGSFYRLLRNNSSTWAGPYALLDTGNYTSHLDSRYVKKSGDTMTGQLIITTSNDDILIFNAPDGEKYFRIKAKANGTDWGGLVLDGRSSVQNLYLGTSTDGYKVWHSGNDGSGSGLDADLLDGTHKSGLLTALTSNATTNLSLTVGGKVKSVADLYATYLEGQTLAGTRRGMSFLSSSFSAAGWYRVFTSTNANTSYVNEVLLHIGRDYYSPQNEHYSFSICVGYNGDISITQLSGVMGGHLITKIRVVWDNSKIFYIDIYSAASSYNNHYGVTGQGDGTFSAFTSGAAIPDGYTAYEFATVDGCKSDRGFSGALSGNASSATKLQTSRTLWGQSFNGTGDVSGNMTGVGSIDSSLFDLRTANFLLYDSASQAKRLTFNWTSDIARIYAINNSGSGYYDMSFGQTPGNSGALYFDASASRWGIGTTAPAYTLDVRGEIRATSGITLSSTDDYGWYITNSRIVAGQGTARGVNVGSLLVSSAWADYTKVPTNGIYSKGNILSAGNIIAYSSSSRLVKDILPKRTTFSQRLTALGSVVDYRYNNVLKRDKELHTGLIYENVKVIMPSMCYMHEGYGALNYLDTDYINLVAGAVQEHTDEIAHLKNKVASLEAEVTRLRRGLAA